jgi:CheY-like chemotaxis protein
MKSIESILIVDDDPTSNYICKYLLSTEFKKLQIKTFINPLDALNHIKEKNCKQENLILLDLNMPEMNGYQFLDHIESIGVDCPVVILTNSNNIIEKEYSKKHPHIKAFFKKPFSKNHINEIKEAVLNKN